MAWGHGAEEEPVVSIALPSAHSDAVCLSHLSWSCSKKEGTGEFSVGLYDLIFGVCVFFPFLQSKNQVHRRGEYNVYSTFQSHEPEFDYLKSLEIEEKINKIRWLPQQNAAYFLLSTNGRWTWSTSFGLFGDIVSKPCILISLSRHFPFYLAGYWKT